MTNAWSLLYDELYGDEKMTDKKKKQPDPDGGINISTGYQYYSDTTGDEIDDLIVDPYTDAFDYSMAGAGIGNTAYDYPSEFTTLSDNDDAMAHHVGLNYDCLLYTSPSPRD